MIRPVRRAFLAACLLVLASCSDSTGNGRRFIAFLSGGVVEPPVTTTASGEATFTDQGASIGFSVQVSTIVAVTRVSVYAGAGGVNGPVIADLYTGPTTGTIASATLVSGTLTAANITGMTPDSLKVLMMTGKAYVQVLTNGRPNGEIRGQIFAN
jgi:hypothetical protein